MAEQQDRNFFGRLTKLFSTQAIVKIDDKGREKLLIPMKDKEILT
jgi:hypothetical protein